MGKPDTWMPLYIADYLADTGHLSTAEHGAYLLLLMHAWMNGGALPNDSERLRRIARMDTKSWRESGPVLREFFTEIDGMLRHARVDAEIQRAQYLVDQRSKAGRASAEKRKAQRESNGCSTDVERALQRGGQQTGKPSPSPSQVLTNPIDALTVSSVDQPPGAPLPGENNGAQTTPPAGAMAAILIRKGVGVTSMNPYLLRWVEKGVTVEQALEALAIARTHKAEAERISAGYLDAIIEGEILNPKPPKAPKPAGPPWWASEATILAKGQEIGVNPRPGEDMANFKGRINAEIERRQREGIAA